MFTEWPTFFTVTGSIITAIIAGVVSVLVARAQSKAQVKAEEVKSNAPEWDLFTTRLMEHIEGQRKEIDTNKEQLKRLHETVEKLDQRSQKLEERLEDQTRRYWQAIKSLRRVFEEHPESVETAELTEAVHVDVFEL